MSSSSSTLSSTIVIVVVAAAILLLVSCFAPVCLASAFADENPIRSVSDADAPPHLRNDHHPFPRLPVDVIYQFGDSLSDVGNLLRVKPSLNCASWPYGESFFDKPTGRCSDGLLIVDYFAKFLNLPLIDEYLKEDGDFKHGVNFAVGGATALNVSVFEKKYNVSSHTNLTLSVQISWFKSHLHSYYPTASDRRRNLAKSLFLLGEIGGNDYNFAFFQGKTLSDAYKMVPDVIQSIRNAVEEVVNLGATQIAVPGNFPVGCVSKYLALFKSNDSDDYDDHNCLKHYNKHSKFHNHELKQTIEELQDIYPEATIVYMDYYEALENIIHHPTKYGFDKATIQEACCGPNDNKYKVNITKMCGTDGVPVCDNPHQHVSWDGVHLTQHAYHVIAKQLMEPINGVAQHSNIWSSNLKFIGICFLFVWVL